MRKLRFQELTELKAAADIHRVAHIKNEICFSPLSATSFLPCHPCEEGMRKGTNTFPLNRKMHLSYWFSTHCNGAWLFLQKEEDSVTILPWGIRRDISHLCSVPGRNTSNKQVNKTEAFSAKAEGFSDYLNSQRADCLQCLQPEHRMRDLQKCPRFPGPGSDMQMGFCFSPTHLLKGRMLENLLTQGRAWPPTRWIEAYRALPTSSSFRLGCFTQRGL